MYRVSDLAMTVAKAWLRESGVAFTVPTRNQLKVGEISFFAGDGKTFVDGEQVARPALGFDGLARALREFGYIQPPVDVASKSARAPLRLVWPAPLAASHKPSWSSGQSRALKNGRSAPKA